MTMSLYSPEDSVFTRQLENSDLIINIVSLAVAYFRYTVEVFVL